MGILGQEEPLPPSLAIRGAVLESVLSGVYDTKDLTTSITKFLIDVRHLCDMHGLDLSQIEGAAKRGYQVELERDRGSQGNYVRLGKVSARGIRRSRAGG